MSALLFLSPLAQAAQDFFEKKTNCNIEREREGLFVSLFAVVAAFSSKQPRGHEHEMKCVADGPGNTCPPFCAPILESSCRSSGSIQEPEGI